MPCKQCKDGKYKWGNTGECKYDSKESCEKANPKKYSEMKQYPTPLGKTYEEYEKELKEYNLSKVERLELSVISEAESTWKEMQKLVNNGADDVKIANDEISEYTKALDVVQKKSKDLNTSYDILEKLRVELNSKLDEAFIYENAIEKQAKELGINLKDIPAYDNLTFFIDEVEDSIDETMKMKDKIEKIIK